MILMCRTLLESVGAAEAVSSIRLSWVVYHYLPSSSLGRNLEFVHGAGDGSPNIHEGHHGIFDVHQLMLANGTPSLTPIQGMAHKLMNRPACETPGWQFIAGSGFKLMLDSLEESMHTSRSVVLNRGYVYPLGVRSIKAGGTIYGVKFNTV